MKNYLYISLYMSILSVVMHYLLFPAEICYATLPVFIISMILWLLALTRNRWWNTIIVVFIHLCFMSLVIYHHFFSQAASLSVISGQIKEGIHSLLVTQKSLLPLKSISGLFLSAVLTGLFSFRRRICPFNLLKKIIVALPMVAAVIVLRLNYKYQPFSDYEFNATAKFFGYPAAWGYELMTASAKQSLLQKLEKDEKIFIKDIQDIKLPENLYVIQFESLDYSALESGAMPHLQKLLPFSAVYQVRPHLKKSSANSDFQVLTLKAVYDESIGVVYKMLSPQFYQTHKSLPQILKERGYKTHFYHGNHGAFFNRRPHIEQMGFDEIYFLEDLENKYQSGTWGIEDADMMNEISSQELSQKNFHFFITVSSHYDFEQGEKITTFIAHPQNLHEKYLNILHETDKALQKLIDSAPDKSMFVVYSDHESETDADRTTVFLIYIKGTDLSRKGTIKVGDIPLYLKQIMTQ